MDPEVQENEIKEENETTAQSDLKKEIPFKKPTLLIGKIGRLSKKLPTLSSTSASSSNSEKLPEADNTQDCIEDSQNQVETYSNVKSDTSDSKAKPAQSQIDSKQAPAELLTEKCIPPYKEPDWSGLPETSGKPYTFEVLKNGSIIETIDLMKKPFWVFGRLSNCDIFAQHPTISRYHVVIQYRNIPSETEPPGFYVYDLGSTHGTYLNGKNNKLKPKVYAPIRVGHMLRLGLSQRSYILTGPEDDQEEESELSVTELKHLRDQKIREQEEKMRLAELELEEKRKKEEEQGIDWGMGDDAHENDEDMSGENPYASTNNEELYLDDPKKALRGFFEREGLDLEYDCTEQGMGQFLCKVELPLDDEMGRPIVAEVLHRGKKKEAVVQCALEACRILDRFGILRQATHESKKRKSKNWEENDYYDSDEDTFLDRTGTIEKKREKRMKVKEPAKVETYESLLQKEKEIALSIADIEKKLNLEQEKHDGASSSSHMEEDSLDSYMKALDNDKLDKPTISKLKLELINLRKSHANVIKLANIAKPANLPPLVPTTSSSTSNINKPKPVFPIFGKRRLVPVKFPAKPIESTETQTSNDADDDESEEEKEDVQPSTNTLKTEETTSLELVNENTDTQIDDKRPKEEHFNEANITSSVEIPSLPSDRPEEEILNFELDGPSEAVLPENEMISDSESSDDEECFNVLGIFRPIQTFHETKTFKTFEKIIKTGLPAIADKHKQKLVKILRKLQRLASNEDRMHSDWKTLSAKKRKVVKWINELRESEDEKLEYRVSVELHRILNELNSMTDDKIKVLAKVKQMGISLKTISMEIDKDIKELKKNIDNTEASTSSSAIEFKNELPSTSNENEEKIDEYSQKSSEEHSQESDEKKRKKNQKRNEQRQYKAEMERQRGYEEDAAREDYNMWVPPTDQSGDGRTNLNDKYGY